MVNKIIARTREAYSEATINIDYISRSLLSELLRLFSFESKLIRGFRTYRYFIYVIHFFIAGYKCGNVYIGPNRKKRLMMLRQWQLSREGLACQTKNELNGFNN